MLLSLHTGPVSNGAEQYDNENGGLGNMELEHDGDTGRDITGNSDQRIDSEGELCNDYGRMDEIGEV
jgi:hypothetical protein